MGSGAFSELMESMLPEFKCDRDNHFMVDRLTSLLSGHPRRRQGYGFQGFFVAAKTNAFCNSWRCDRPFFINHHLYQHLPFYPPSLRVFRIDYFTGCLPVKFLKATHGLRQYQDLPIIKLFSQRVITDAIDQLADMPAFIAIHVSIIIKNG